MMLYILFLSLTSNIVLAIGWYSCRNSLAGYRRTAHEAQEREKAARQLADWRLDDMRKARKTARRLSDQNKMLRINKSCARKVGYGAKKEAERHGKPYRCTECEKWHATTAEVTLAETKNGQVLEAIRGQIAEG